MANEVNGEEVQGMVGHWLSTPTNGYLGSSYGNDAPSLLQKPNAAGLGDAFLAKLTKDVPLLSALPGGAVNLYLERVGNDSNRLVINVADSLIRVDSAGNVT